MNKEKILHSSNRIFDGRLRIYLSLKCNLNCPYCVNEQGEVRASKSNFKYKDHKKWSSVINKIGKNVVFTGGEPTIFPGFTELLNDIDKNIEIAIYSNLKFDVEPFILKIKRPLRFLISYHPQYGSVDIFIKNLLRLKSVKDYNITVHSILWKNQESFIKTIKDKFSDVGIKLFLDEDQLDDFEGSAQKYKKKVRCSRTIILISPDGTRYPCVSKMIRQKSPMKNIFEEKLGRDEFTNICEDYGYCAACDALGKTEMVEI